MVCIQAVLTQFVRDKKGTSALGYALIAALLTFILIGAAGMVGANLGTTFAGVASSVGGIAARQTATAPSGQACRSSITVQPTAEQCQPDYRSPGLAG